MLQDTEHTGKTLRAWGLTHVASNGLSYIYAPPRADKGTTNNSASVIRICLSKDAPLWSSG